MAGWLSGWLAEGLTYSLHPGLCPAQVDNMTKKWHVYMTRDGRISLAGLSLSRAEYLAQAIIDSIKNA